MEKVQLIFARGHSIGSYAIRLRYQSRWSHVGIIIDGFVHEAVYSTDDNLFSGVVATPLEDFKARYGDGNWEIATALAKPNWRKRADDLLWLEYDLWGAIGIGFGTRKLDDPKKLWCSHHVGIILGTLRPERLNRLAPEHLWLFTQPLMEGNVA